MPALTIIVALLAASGDAPQPAQEKLRCKRIQETGSFAKSRRVCLTEAQWRELQAETDRLLKAMDDAARVNSTRPRGQ